MTRKEFIQKAKKVAKSIMHVNKYLVVLVLGVLLVGFFSDSSVVAHISNMNRMKELRAEIAQHKALTKANLDQIDKMNFDRKTLERVARERYFMKQKDEDVFVLSDDPQTPDIMLGNETVE